MYVCGADDEVPRQRQAKSVKSTIMSVSPIESVTVFGRYSSWSNK